ncbi:MAG: thioredoxin domain-containing protein [Terriglobia bacterium]
MTKRLGKYIGVFVGSLLALGSAWLIGNEGRSATTATSDAATRQKIIRYVRARFGVPDSVKLTADPLRPFTYPQFLQTTITSDDGKQKHSNPAFVTKDGRYLIFGSLFMSGADPNNEIVQHVRELFKIQTASSVTAGPFRNSTFPNLLATTVTVDDGKQKVNQDFYLTQDNRCLIVGTIFDLAVDPKREALRTIVTADQPSQGPARAPVTVVEFSDLQCPACPRLHEFLEKELLPKYGNKVRVVYKEFPLPAIHDWTLTGSIACQCAYQISPPAYVPYRSLIFKNQTSFNAANARDLLLDYGEQAGVDRLRLAACIDSKASLPRVEANMREGNLVGVSRTPTAFVNGKMVVGLESADAFYKVVDEALRALAK